MEPPVKSNQENISEIMRELARCDAIIAAIKEEIAKGKRNPHLGGSPEMGLMDMVGERMILERELQIAKELTMSEPNKQLDAMQQRLERNRLAAEFQYRLTDRIRQHNHEHGRQLHPIQHFHKQHSDGRMADMEYAVYALSNGKYREEIKADIAGYRNWNKTSPSVQQEQYMERTIDRADQYLSMKSIGIRR